MGSTKKTRKSHNPHPQSAGKPARRFTAPLLWFAVTAGIAWALMHYSSPQSQLEPYTKFKKTSVQAAEKETKPADDDSETLARTHDADPVAETAAAPSPPSGVNLPREALEHISKGMELTEQGKFNAGALEFEKAAKIAPDSPELFSIWGAALRMQKRFQGASKKFARAHELAPDDVEILFNWGMTAVEQRESDEAIRLFKKTLQLEPDNYLAYNYLGKSYGQKKMYAEEEASYRKAIELNPDFGWAHFNLGVVLGIQKKYEEAADPFERAIAIDKSFEKPFVIQLLTAMGRYTPNTPAPEPEKAETIEQAKAEPQKEPEPAKEPEVKKSEGSDHKAEGSKMEGSKMKKETTNLKGVIKVNGQPITRPSVVFLETKNKLRVPNQKTVELKVVQSGLQFIPQHSVVPVGSKVTFVNQDREVHNIYSKSRNNQFNLGAMAAGSQKTLEFTQAGPVVLRCNMHKDMLGTIFVVPNGYHTEPDENGEYSFDKVKSQGYLLQVWHPSLDPAIVEKQLKPIELNGDDQNIDFTIASASKPGEIHDLVDPTDYNAIVDNIEKEMFQAIEDWKQGKKSIPRKRMLMAITKHFDGEGLKGAIAKSFSHRRSIQLERKLDEIRKMISGIGVKKGEVTEEILKNKAEFVVSQLRNNVRELEARLNPEFESK